MSGSGNHCWQQKFLGGTSPKGLWVRIPSRGQKIEVAFQPLPMADIIASVQVVMMNQVRVPPINEQASQEPHPTYGPHPNTQVADFNLKKKEVEHLPFKLNLGDIPLEKEHQARFIDLVYSNQEVFSCMMRTWVTVTN